MGWAYLTNWFGEDVTEAVRLHVDAKRFLCASDPDYDATLSAASRHTLRLQGGAFTQAEAADFIAQPFAREAVRLRLWDDLGKDPAMETPTVDHFLELAASQIRPGAEA